jgi:hypothetical protein
MKNGGALKARINAVAQAAEDRAFADDIRAWHPDAVAHLDDESLAAKVTQARERAIAFGLADPRLRARFVMIACTLAPDFWRNPLFFHTLNGRTGTADMRFGDVCAALHVSSLRAGYPDLAWWK